MAKLGFKITTSLTLKIKTILMASLAISTSTYTQRLALISHLVLMMNHTGWFKTRRQCSIACDYYRKIFYNLYDGSQKHRFRKYLHDIWQYDLMMEVYEMITRMMTNMTETLFPYTTLFRSNNHMQWNIVDTFWTNQCGSSSGLCERSDPDIKYK